MTSNQQYKEIACSVMLLAFSDLTNKTDIHRDDAIHFFESGDYVFFCIIADLNNESVFEKYKTIINKAIPCKEGINEQA